MAERRAARVDVAFFQPDLTEPNTTKRVETFIERGHAPVVFAFRRARFNLGYVPPWPHVRLSRTWDGKYLRRLAALLRAIPVLFGHRRLLRSARLFYARNIDQLALALCAKALFNRRAAVAYEVLDIQPIMVRAGFASRALRAIERRLMRHVRLVVVSSTGFQRHYFEAMQGYRGDWFLLENKLNPSAIAHIVRTPSRLRDAVRGRGKYRWAVGYFGLIRGDATLELLGRLAERLSGEVLFRLAGVPTTVDRALLRRTLERNPNIVYQGEFANPTELPRLYASVDFAWAIDLENVDNNSSWLLPCRYYEAGLFGVPCLAVRGFELGSLVETLGVGWAFDEPLERGLVDFFRGLSRETYDRRRFRLESMPRSSFVAEEDGAELCRRLFDETRDRAGSGINAADARSFEDILRRTRGRR
jgi:succinoglycan biosynthesis protein ExoL